VGHLVRRDSAPKLNAGTLAGVTEKLRAGILAGFSTKRKMGFGASVASVSLTWPNC